jgi:hypothetical protein
MITIPIRATHKEYQAQTRFRLEPRYVTDLYMRVYGEIAHHEIFAGQNRLL